MHLYRMARSRDVEDPGFTTYMLHHAEFTEDEFQTLVLNVLGFAVDEIGTQDLRFSVFRAVIARRMCERYGFTILESKNAVVNFSVADYNKLSDVGTPASKHLAAVSEHMDKLGFFSRQEAWLGIDWGREFVGTPNTPQQLLGVNNMAMKSVLDPLLPYRQTFGGAVGDQRSFLPSSREIAKNLLRQAIKNIKHGGTVYNRMIVPSQKTLKAEWTVEFK